MGEPVTSGVDGERRGEGVRGGTHTCRRHRTGAAVDSGVADTGLPQRMRGLLHNGADVSLGRRAPPHRPGSAAMAATVEEGVDEPPQRCTWVGSWCRGVAVAEPGRRVAGAADTVWVGRSGQDLDAGVLVVAEAVAGGDDRTERIGVVIGCERKPVRVRGPQLTAGDDWSVDRDWRDGGLPAGGRGRPCTADSGLNRGHGHRAGHPQADGQLPPGPPVLPHHVRCSVDDSPAPRWVERAGQVSPQRTRAREVDLRRRCDRHELGVVGVMPMTPPDECDAACDPDGDRRHGDQREPGSVDEPHGSVLYKKRRPGSGVIATGRTGCRGSFRRGDERCPNWMVVLHVCLRRPVALDARHRLVPLTCLRRWSRFGG